MILFIFKILSNLKHEKKMKKKTIQTRFLHRFLPFLVGNSLILKSSNFLELMDPVKSAGLVRF